MHARTFLFSRPRPASPPAGTARVLPFSMWVDSSPQGGRNWVLTHMHSICNPAPAKLMELAMVVDTLAAAPSLAEGSDGGSGSDSADSDTDSADSDPDPDPDASDSCGLELETDAGDVAMAGTDDAAAATDRLQRLSARRLTRRLCRGFEWHSPPPAAVGSARENLQQKCAAVLHSLCWETPTPEDLPELLAGC
eukprot:10051790-Lingulodinium_polyedra.AAC.1